jgi:hypothetical protein
MDFSKTLSQKDIFIRPLKLTSSSSRSWKCQFCFETASYRPEHWRQCPFCQSDLLPMERNEELALNVIASCGPVLAVYSRGVKDQFRLLLNIPALKLASDTQIDPSVTITVKLDKQLIGDCHSLKFSRDGTRLAFFSDVRCYVVTGLPRWLPDMFSFETDRRTLALTCSVVDLTPPPNTVVNRNRIVQVEPHPLSAQHFMLLWEAESKQSLLQLCNVARPGESEQDFPLDECFVGFCLGELSDWPMFTVFLLGADAKISALCPVVPFDCAVPTESLKALTTRVNGLLEAAKPGSNTGF